MNVAGQHRGAWVQAVEAADVPELRYAEGVYYDDTMIVQGMPVDAACQADHAACVNGVYDSSAAPVTSTNHSLLTVIPAHARGLAGARSVG